MHSDADPGRALAVAELVDHDRDLLDVIEGTLLTAAGRGERIGWFDLVSATALGEETCANLVRQLEDAGALRCTTDRGNVQENAYRAGARRTRAICAASRTAIEVLDAHAERVTGPTSAEPLVTFPEDPAFASVTPTQFGMSQLMSALVSSVKQADESITLLAPFFEGDGLAHLADVLFDALDRDVELTIVTRYLGDPDSHNYTVISSFMERARERGVADRVTLVDYTGWDEDVSPADRRQNGPNPAFTLHAKVMLFDANSVYIGSANVTDYGFDRYLELGVLLRGPPVAQFAELCSFLLASEGATNVDL